MKSVLNLFKSSLKDADKQDSSKDIYPKYRVIKKYDHYIVEVCAFTPGERRQSGRYLPDWSPAEWEPATWENFVFKWNAVWYANRRIAKDERTRRRNAYNNHTVWGPEP